MSVILYGRASGKKYQLDVGLYPDNTPVVDLREAWDGEGGKFRAIIIRALSIQDLVSGLMVVHSIKERGGEVSNLILPHVPGGRQDRLKWEGDWLFTLKYVAGLINQLQFSTVVTLDPHSLATTALIDRVMVPEIHLDGLFKWYGQFMDIPKYDGVIAPDAGAAKRAEKVAEQLGVPVYYARKKRDPETNKLSGFAIPDDLPSNSHYLVVDDICDAGGTFIGLAKVIAEEGDATADLFVTHGIFSKEAGLRLKKHYGNVYATDSIDRLADGVTYFKIVEGLLNA